eukprot:GHVR01034758.1.p2 GENE.GHVR01034758.1~~GHVR01034758.1.p2  ORF type:complete len:138 (-),score=26.66 GHVR01034758.1:266-679(-)
MRYKRGQNSNSACVTSESVCGNSLNVCSTSTAVGSLSAYRKEFESAYAAANKNNNRFTQLLSRQEGWMGALPDGLSQIEAHTQGCFPTALSIDSPFCRITQNASYTQPNKRIQVLLYDDAAGPRPPDPRHFYLKWCN